MQTQVVLWQGAGGAGHDLAFMYRPVMDTLRNGFLDMPARVASSVGPVHLTHGYGVGNLFRQHGMLANLRAGDVFIWLGPTGSGSPPWHKLYQRGVRTIYYQTEPAEFGCSKIGAQVSHNDLHEIWEFSWHNVDVCAPKLKKGLTMRYVPLGFSPPPAVNVAAEPPLATTATHADLIFFGYPFYKSGRRVCFDALKRELGDRINATWSLWNATEFETWWHASGRTAVHLNLHKTCENSHNPVVFRTALLLSRGAHVISERSYAKDEAEYAGLVHFAAVSEMPRLLDAVLKNASRDDARVSVPTPAIVARRLRSSADIARLYARRFAPRRIFERAGVYDVLQPTNESAARFSQQSAAFDPTTVRTRDEPRGDRGRPPGLRVGGSGEISDSVRGASRSQNAAVDGGRRGSGRGKPGARARVPKQASIPVG